MRPATLGSLAVFFVVAAGSAAAHAGSLPLPDINVERHCKAAAALGNNGVISTDVLLTCMKQEQQHYDRLKLSKWGSASDQVQRACSPVWATYQTIDFCIDRETLAEGELKTFRFIK